MAKTIKVTLVRSGINRLERQKRTIERLGLARPHQSIVLPDNVAVRGMIRAVSHMVKIEPAD